jgi:hypothetical protein
MAPRRLALLACWPALLNTGGGKRPAAARPHYRPVMMRMMSPIRTWVRTVTVTAWVLFLCPGGEVCVTDVVCVGGWGRNAAKTCRGVGRGGAAGACRRGWGVGARAR